MLLAQVKNMIVKLPQLMTALPVLLNTELNFADVQVEINGL